MCSPFIYSKPQIEEEIEKSINEHDKKLIKWVKNHYWDSLEKDKHLILRHLRTFTGDIKATEPSDIYKTLDAEFNFDFDPCPYPLPEGFNCLDVPWGNMNYVNPPFRKDDWKYGAGPTALIRKAISEQENGKSSIIILNTTSHIRLLAEASKEVRSMDRVRWLDIYTKEPWKSPSNTILFVLKGKENG